MKLNPGSIFAIFVLTFAFVFAGTPPSTAPRLNEVSKFPTEYQPAVRAVIAAVEKKGLKPGEYFAEISKEKSVLHFWLIHESHNPDPDGFGDSCRKCSTVDYDLKTGTVSRILGIR